MYIAETTGARVEGITLSNVQLQIARERSRQSAAAELVSFTKQDYNRTTFREATFSKVVGIESVCHANNKLDFLMEAFRIMKPGGRIVVVDAFLTKEELDPKEQQTYTKVIEGWVLPNLVSIAVFSGHLSAAGFEHVVFCDMQRFVKKSVKVAWQPFIVLTSPV